MIRDLKGGQPWVTRRGAHELCIQREAPSSLVFSRWSRKENRVKLFASLSFVTYEGMTCPPPPLLVSLCGITYPYWAPY